MIIAELFETAILILVLRKLNEKQIGKEPEYDFSSRKPQFWKTKTNGCSYLKYPNGSIKPAQYFKLHTVSQH